MTPLPKHVRQRWRYLAVTVETWPDVTVQRRSFQRALWRAVRTLLGDVGSAEAVVSVVRYDGAAGGADVTVRARRGAVDEARAALACLDAIEDQPIGVRVRGVSGTVDGCEAYFDRDRTAIEKGDSTFEGVDRPAWVRDGRVDVAVDDGFVGATRLDT